MKLGSEYAVEGKLGEVVNIHLDDSGIVMVTIIVRADDGSGKTRNYYSFEREWVKLLSK